MEWVRLKTYLQETGESRATWYRVRADGMLLENKHYRHDQRGRVWVNIKAMKSWVENKQPRGRKRRSVA